MECEYEKRKKCDSLYIERYNKLLKENEELKSIIDKAKEYLTSTTHFVLEYDKPFRKLSKYEEQYEKREEDLLNILKGEDKC